jgi:hypothetical protein
MKINKFLSVAALLAVASTSNFAVAANASVTPNLLSWADWADHGGGMFQAEKIMTWTGGSFSDNLTFSTGAASNVSVVVKAWGGYTLTSFSGNLNGGTPSSTTGVSNPQISLAATSTAATSYTLSLTGLGGASAEGTYNVFVYASPVVASVPEPETYAMLLTGLGIIGAVARRRSKKVASA